VPPVKNHHNKKRHKKRHKKKLNDAMMDVNVMFLREGTNMDLAIN
jgi:hypothetical protein